MSNILARLYALLFVFRKTVFIGFKPLELLFPILLLPSIIHGRLVLPRQISFVLVFVAFALVHSLVFTVLKSDPRFLADAVRYVFSVMAALALLTAAATMRFNEDMIISFLVILTSFVVVPLCILAVLFPSEPFLQIFVSQGVNNVLGRPDRIIGLDENPNYFGFFLTLMSAFALSKAFHNTNLVSICSVVMILLGVALTFSRTSVVVVLFQFLGFLYLLRRVINFRVSFTLLVMGILLGVFLYQSDYLDAFLARFKILGDQTVSATEETRWRIWRSVVPLIAENPWFGVGLGNIENEIYLNTGRGYSAHNEYLHMAASFGLLGGFLFFIFHCCLYYQALRQYLTRRGEIDAAFSVFFLSCFVFFVFNTVSTSRVYWLAAAIFWISQRNARQEKYAALGV